jgi:hypothetical protein
MTPKTTDENKAEAEVALREAEALLVLLNSLAPNGVFKTETHKAQAADLLLYFVPKSLPILIAQLKQAQAQTQAQAANAEAEADVIPKGVSVWVWHTLKNLANDPRWLWWPGQEYLLPTGETGVYKGKHVVTEPPQPGAVPDYRDSIPGASIPRAGFLPTPHHLRCVVDMVWRHSRHDPNFVRLDGAQENIIDLLKYDPSTKQYRWTCPAWAEHRFSSEFDAYCFAFFQAPVPGQPAQPAQPKAGE